MKRPTIFEANAFLHDPVRYRESLIRHVATSSAIETGESVEAIAKRLGRYYDAGMPPLKARRRRSSR